MMVAIIGMLAGAYLQLTVLTPQAAGAQSTGSSWKQIKPWYFRIAIWI